MADILTGEGVTKDACPECESTDIKVLPVEKDDTWGRSCNVCFAIWGLRKQIANSTAGSTGFYTFHHSSAEVKSLMNYKEDSE